MHIGEQSIKKTINGIIKPPIVCIRQHHWKQQWFAKQRGTKLTL